MFRVKYESYPMSASDRYNAAGVNIAAGESFVSRISPLVGETHKTLVAHGATMRFCRRRAIADRHEDPRFIDLR